MQFYMSEVCKIIGLKQGRLKEWLKMGGISPSIRLASGPGKRNVFSRNDLYLIQLFEQITVSGWYRDVATSFLKCLSKAHVDLLVAYSHAARNWAIVEAIMLDELHPVQNISLLYAELPLVAGSCNKERLAYFRERSGNVTALLGFTRADQKDGVLFSSFIVAEDVNEDFNFDAQIEKSNVDERFAFFPSELGDLMGKGVDMYIVNLSRLMIKVDLAIYKFYPEKLRVTVMDYIAKVSGRQE